jgi:8-amino-7-oxononanoate synthase
MTWQARINSALDERRAAEAFRVRRVVENGAGRFLTREGQQFCNFSSNDYLGLSQHPAIIRAWQQGAERFGVGSGGSGHVSGYTTAHQALEEALADWLGYPRALLFISGFAANQAVITALMGKDDRIVADRLSHASLLEAANLSPAQLRRFAHNDAGSLLRCWINPATDNSWRSRKGCSAWTATARRLPRCTRPQSGKTPGCWWTMPTALA